MFDSKPPAGSQAGDRMRNPCLVLRGVSVLRRLNRADKAHRQTPRHTTYLPDPPGRLRHFPGSSGATQDFGGLFATRNPKILQFGVGKSPGRKQD